MLIPSLLNKLKKRSKLVIRFAKRLLYRLITVMIFLALLTAVLWAGFVLWIHLNDHPFIRGVSLLTTVGLSLTVVRTYFQHSPNWKKWLSASGALWLVLATWYIWLPPKQDRPWQAEVAQMLSVTRSETNPDLLTLHNVRDFMWDRAPDAPKIVQPQQPYYYKVVEDSGKDIVATERWTDREIDLSKLSGVDIINSYWMGERIGHTLLSFNFENERPLTFSIEIRKEQDESFSAIGGFFKQFEMIVVAAEERDIVYTRSNVRSEQVYIFPVKGMNYAQTRALFNAYLQRAEDLQQQPRWYNTLIRNCTTMIFDMARDVTDNLFPNDYRILVSGYVPNYLYDHGLLPDVESNLSLDQMSNEFQTDETPSRHSLNQSSQPSQLSLKGPFTQKGKWTMQDWYIQAHINPKVVNFNYEDNQQGYHYSEIIRQGLPPATF